MKLGVGIGTGGTHSIEIRPESRIGYRVHGNEGSVIFKVMEDAVEYAVKEAEKPQMPKL